MGRINASANGTMSLPLDEIRPLLRIIDGLRTVDFCYSYDDAGQCDSGCGYYEERANSVLNRLSFTDLARLARYSDKRGFERLEVSMSRLTFWLQFS